MNLDKLDTVHSIWIRKRFADDRGYVKCVTCPSVAHWKTMDASHFIPRGKLATRYHEKNCHVGCTQCNRFLRGNLVKYEIFMRSEYGEEVIEELRIKSRESVKWMPHEIQEMIEMFKSKIKRL